MYGVSVQNEDAWIVPCVGLALTIFGLQVATTVSYAYMSDCYKAQSDESAALINVFRMTIAFTTGFWVLKFGEAIGFDEAWGILVAMWFVASCLSPCSFSRAKNGGINRVSQTSIATFNYYSVLGRKFVNLPRG